MSLGPCTEQNRIETLEVLVDGLAWLALYQYSARKATADARHRIRTRSACESASLTLLHSRPTLVVTPPPMQTTTIVAAMVPKWSKPGTVGRLWLSRYLDASCGSNGKWPYRA
ncbi:uncharacterized protein K489DRAFT_88774 [Dissoconium aciculare CBS 342.82]|uniref:Uncharacterized protein n=1 Tax=Dissoconium aciculare CBS 342.82 TaxID=1314786 RepID=A0A6J3LSD7_9PEZI|nr:uncharacterized protein K489DRAFT_88774 [Dissoconium aciculare CBS 342.82]KAF1818701.1 hypothetical protein K489DRAFT_88774 [Dissoconium aciculare CBS 342.82]